MDNTVGFQQTDLPTLKVRRRKRKKNHVPMVEMREEGIQKLYKKLHLNFSQKKAERLQKERGVDIVVKKGIIPGLLTDRERKQEITRTNNKMIDVLERTQTLQVLGDLRTRSSKSQAVLLAARYGGTEFEKVARTVRDELAARRPSNAPSPRFPSVQNTLPTVHRSVMLPAASRIAVYDGDKVT